MTLKLESLLLNQVVLLTGEPYDSDKANSMITIEPQAGAGAGISATKKS